VLAYFWDMSRPDYDLSSMDSDCEMAELSDYDGCFSCHGVPDKAYWLKQASCTESTISPDECSLFSRDSTELTSTGHHLQSQLYQNILQAAVADCYMSVHVIDPSQSDFPIIAVSQGMSVLTEYRQQELLGKNSCRLLSSNCDNDPVNIAHLREACTKGASFETTVVNRKKSGQLYQVLLVLRRIALANDETIGQDHGFLLELQIELPHEGDDDNDGTDYNDGALTLAPPELIAHTKDAAEKLASHLSQLLQKAKGSTFLDPLDSYPEQCSMVQDNKTGTPGLVQVGLGLAPLLIFDLPRNKGTHQIPQREGRQIQGVFQPSTMSGHFL